MLLDDIEKNFPFISVVEYGGQEYVGVINNQDNAITSMYIYTDIHSKLKEAFLELGGTSFNPADNLVTMVL